VPFGIKDENTTITTLFDNVITPQSRHWCSLSTHSSTHSS